MQPYLSGLLLAIALLSLLPSLSLGRTIPGTLLGTSVYLKATNSSIPGYKTVSLIKPSGSVNNSISLNVSTSGSYLIGSWISPWVFSSMTISDQYNFLFSMYGNASGLARFHGEFLIYRGGTLNQSLFNSSLSSPLNANASNMLWQSKTSMNITFLSGDRLVFRLYLNASPGQYKFWYDSRYFPSYLTDPTEIRYFKYGSVTVNGLTCFPLATDTSGTYWSQSRTAIGYLGCNIGIRVWKRSSIETETEVTSGTPVAQVSCSDGDSHKLSNNTWACPLTSLESTDSIVVRVYAQFASWLQIGSSIFTTEQLGASQLDSASWTVYYYLSFVYNYKLNRGVVTLDFDGAYQSRIENFTWTSGVTKAWNNVASWPFTLVGKAWSIVAFWPFTFTAKAWIMVSSWSLNLITEAWNLVASWSLNLMSGMWNPISSWIFSLTPFSTAFLLIPLIFLVGVVLFLMAVALGKKFHNEF